MLEDVVVVWCVNWFERVWNGAPFHSCLLMHSKCPMGGLGAIIMGPEPECICECGIVERRRVTDERGTMGYFQY